MAPGMAHVAFEWMMSLRAQKQGLIFKNNFFQTVRDDANPRGRYMIPGMILPSSTRYHPREIKNFVNAS